MIQVMKCICLTLALSLMAGCAGPVPRIESNPAVLSKINALAVINPPEAKTYAVMNFGHPGMAFGLIGGLVAAADQTSKQEQLTAALKKENLSVSQALASALVAKLSSAGFQARAENGPWEEKDGKYILEFEKIQSDADAVVVLTPTITGFIATGATSDYLPTVTVVVTLLDKDRKTPIYRGFHSAGWEPKAEGWKHSPPTTTFGNFDALMADPRNTAKALAAAALAVSSSIADDLRR
jgi:hypothetical protein